MRTRTHSEGVLVAWFSLRGFRCVGGKGGAAALPRPGSPEFSAGSWADCVQRVRCGRALELGVRHKLQKARGSGTCSHFGGRPARVGKSAPPVPRPAPAHDIVTPPGSWGSCFCSKCPKEEGCFGRNTRCMPSSRTVASTGWAPEEWGSSCFPFLEPSSCSPSPCLSRVPPLALRFHGDCPLCITAQGPRAPASEVLIKYRPWCGRA